MSCLELIQDSISYIEENLQEKIGLEEIAGHACLSKFHFHRLFHSAVGSSPGDYVRKRRLSEAARELRETNGKIVDIALKYQFGSQESFSRAFKRYFGLSPSEFRKEQKDAVVSRRIEVPMKNRTYSAGSMLSAA